MISQLKKTSNQILKLLPNFLGEILTRYLRVEVHGLENIPNRGATLIIANHSGFSGFDVFVLAHILHKRKKRLPRILSHHLWFLTKTTSIPAKKLGFIEANFENGVKYLKKKNLVVIFPEGEYGNFKPTSEKYQLQEFKRGFVRMALASEAQIVPALVIGAEETHINLSQIKLTKFLRGTILPLPLNLIPLPVKWHIHFLKPLDMPYDKQALEDPDLIREIASDTQEIMQEALRARVKKHKLF